MDSRAQEPKDCEGWLRKNHHGSVFAKKNVKRYFVASGFTVFYYPDEKQGTVKGHFDLRNVIRLRPHDPTDKSAGQGAVEVWISEPNSTTPPKRMVLCFSLDPSKRTEWLTLFSSAVLVDYVADDFKQFIDPTLTAKLDASYGGNDAVSSNRAIIKKYAPHTSVLTSRTAVTAPGDNEATPAVPALSSMPQPDDSQLDTPRAPRVALPEAEPAAPPPTRPVVVSKPSVRDPKAAAKPRSASNDVGGVALMRLLVFNAAFAVVAAAVLYPCLGANAPPPYSSGSAVGGLVLLWNLLFVATVAKGELYRMWRFSAVVSAFQLVPDMVLVALGTLEFPDDGAPQLLGVSAYMAGMWTIPFVLILALSSRHGNGGGGAPSAIELICAAVVSLTVFGLSEHLLHPLQLWQCTDAVAWRVGNAAVYVLPPEALLGAILLLAYRIVPQERMGARTIAAIAVALVYTAALVASLALLERLKVELVAGQADAVQHAGPMNQLWLTVMEMLRTAWGVLGRQSMGMRARSLHCIQACVHFGRGFALGMGNRAQSLFAFLGRQKL